MRTATFSDIIKLAQFCAELTRQGIAFSVTERGDDFVVNMTGY